MSPVTVSAQFAAYVWFNGQRNNAHKSDADAVDFARDNWEAFLPLAHPGLGRLLLQIAGGPPPVAQRPAHARALVETPYAWN
jgi:hypothetical protein